MEMEDSQLDFKSAQEELDILKNEKNSFEDKISELEELLSRKNQEIETLSDTKQA